MNFFMSFNASNLDPMKAPYVNTDIPGPKSRLLLEEQKKYETSTVTYPSAFPFAIKKAENDFDFDGKAFVVGDTPRDIKAGREGNGETIAVATGTYSMEELQDCGADFVFDDLRDKNEILKIVEDV